MRAVFRWAALLITLAIVASIVAIITDIIVHRQATPAQIAAIIDAAEPSERSLSEERRQQLLAVEDPSFYDHNGIDLSTPGQGLTTLGQGLVKHIYFDDFAPGLRKIRLIYLTRFALFGTTSHDAVLTAFLANAYLGRGPDGAVVGFDQGARTWFGKPLEALSEDEFLALVAMLVSPNALRPTDNGPANQDRVTRIKKLLSNECVPDGLRDVWLEGCAGA